MKILMLNYEYPPLGGGAGVCSKYEAEGLAKLGHRVTVVTTWFKGEKEEESKGNLRIIRLKSKRRSSFKSNPFEMYSWIRESKKFLNNYLKENNFDISIANFTIPGGIVALYLKNKFNLNYIVISHGHDIPWFFPKQMLKFHVLTYFIIKRVCINAERVVLLTSDMKKNADNFMGKKNSYKNIIIPNGCNTRQFKPNFSRKSKNLKILFVGRLTEQKDPMTFLKAMQILSNKGVKFDALILGDGPMRKKMELFVSKNNISEVKFLGWVSKDKMLEEYQSATLQVVTSLGEAMSIAVLESVCCGQTIISTPVSGNTDLLPKQNLVNFKDPEEIVSKITNKPKAISKKMLDSIRERYDWDNIAKEYELLLKELKR